MDKPGWGAAEALRRTAASTPTRLAVSSTGSADHSSPADRTATELRQLVAAREVSAAAILDACLDRVERLNETINNEQPGALHGRPDSVPGSSMPRV